MAIDAVWEAAKTWNQSSATYRSNILLKIADIMEANLETLAKVETWDNGKAVKLGYPLDPTTMMGAQASGEQYDKILNYIKLGKGEGCQVLTGGDKAYNEGLAGGYYIQPTVLVGNNKMRVFQEEIWGPVVAVTTFKDEAEAIEIANDTPYGLGAGVWTRDMHQAYQISRAV